MTGTVFENAKALHIPELSKTTVLLPERAQHCEVYTKMLIATYMGLYNAGVLALPGTTKEQLEELLLATFLRKETPNWFGRELNTIKRDIRKQKSLQLIDNFENTLNANRRAMADIGIDRARTKYNNAISQLERSAGELNRLQKIVTQDINEIGRAHV